jgi:hypothetical protein
MDKVYEPKYSKEFNVSCNKSSNIFNRNVNSMPLLQHISSLLIREVKFQDSSTNYILTELKGYHQRMTDTEFLKCTCKARCNLFYCLEPTVYVHMS